MSSGDNNRIIMRIHDALHILENNQKMKTEFYKELLNYPDKNDWLVEVDVRDNPTERKFYFVKNCPENNKLLLRHQVINLKDI